jgi:hypothetical protein
LRRSSSAIRARSSISARGATGPWWRRNMGGGGGGGRRERSYAGKRGGGSDKATRSADGGKIVRIGGL